MTRYDFDLFTIGAGSGGVRASRMAAGYGARVAVAEASRLGGTCVNVGCVPKKLMVFASHFRDDFEQSKGFGWSVGPTTFDWPTLIQRKNEEILRLNRIYEKLLRESGVEVMNGRARLVDPHAVEVDGRRFTANHILCSTGGRPVRPSERGAELGFVSDDIFALEKQPERVVIVGSGYIAVEFAGVFHGLGSEVTVLCRGPHILRDFDEDAHTFLLGEIRKHGIRVLLDTSIRSIEKTSRGLGCDLSSGAPIEADAVLHAIGREPNTAGLGLEQLGVRTSPQGAIVVDAYSTTSVPSVHAIGDVTNRISLTPVAIAEGAALARTLFGGAPTIVDYEGIPTAVFSQPPLSCVGLTEAKAKAKAAFGPIDVYASEFKPLKHTLSMSSERSFMKLVVQATTGRVLGVHMVGADAPEIIQGLAVAIKCGATKAQFDATIGIHPTSAEEFVTLRDKRAPTGA